MVNKKSRQQEKKNFVKKKKEDKQKVFSVQCSCVASYQCLAVWATWQNIKRAQNLNGINSPYSKVYAVYK